jgi:hypothetical protein
MVNIEIETGGMLIPIFELPEEDKKIYEEAIKMEHPSPQPSPFGGEGVDQISPPLLSKGEGIGG